MSCVISQRRRSKDQKILRVITLDREAICANSANRRLIAVVVTRMQLLMTGSHHHTPSSQAFRLQHPVAIPMTPVLVAAQLEFLSSSAFTDIRAERGVDAGEGQTDRNVSGTLCLAFCAFAPRRPNLRSATQATGLICYHSHNLSSFNLHRLPHHPIIVLFQHHGGLLPWCLFLFLLKLSTSVQNRKPLPLHCLHT